MVYRASTSRKITHIVKVYVFSILFLSPQPPIAHYERGPLLNPSTMRSIYHTREIDVYKMLLLRPPTEIAEKKDNFEPLDIMVSHDWPREVPKMGPLSELLKAKPFFKDDIANNNLGSPPNQIVLDSIRPKRWFSAHLHVRYEASICESGETTAFLALDKPGPKRKYMEMLQIASESKKEDLHLSYDPEWLAVIKATQSEMKFTRERQVMPPFSGMRLYY